MRRVWVAPALGVLLTACGSMTAPPASVPELPGDLPTSEAVRRSESPDPPESESPRGFEGSGDLSTEAFPLAGGAYRIEWSATAVFGYPCLLEVVLENDTGHSDLVLDLFFGADEPIYDTTHAWGLPPGMYHFDVNSTCGWTLLIEEDDAPTASAGTWDVHVGPGQRWSIVVPRGWELAGEDESSTSLIRGDEASAQILTAPATGLPPEELEAREVASFSTWPGVTEVESEWVRLRARNALRATFFVTEPVNGGPIRWIFYTIEDEHTKYVFMVIGRGFDDDSVVTDGRRWPSRLPSSTEAPRVRPRPPARVVVPLAGASLLAEDRVAVPLEVLG